MTLETIVETAGILLVAAVMLRASMAAIVLAGQNMNVSLRARRQMNEFRDQAGKRLSMRGPSLRSLEERGPQQSQDLAQPRAKNPALRQFKIVKRVYENLKGDVCSFYLAPDDGKPIASYRPGQFLTFELNIPGEPQPVTRCYSLSQCPTNPQDTYRVTIKRLLAPPNAARGTRAGLSSNYFHDRLPEGSVVEATLPAGEFCLDHTSVRPVVLVAGGVGATPLISMLNWLAAMQSQREIWFFYGVRDRSDHAFYDQLKVIRERMPNVRTVVFYANPSARCHKGLDYDVEGYVSVDVMRTLLKANNYEFYVCGPPAMMQTVTTGLRKWGVGEPDIMTESFGASAAPAATAPPDALVGGKDTEQSFRVKFAKSKKTVKWTGRNGSLLELAEVCGVRARCACRAGQCGTCKIAISSGEVGYVSQPQAELEAGFCLPCIAHPKTDLVLEL